MLRLNREFGTLVYRLKSVAEISDFEVDQLRRWAPSGRDLQIALVEKFFNVAPRDARETAVAAFKGNPALTNSQEKLLLFWGILQETTEKSLVMPKSIASAISRVLAMGLE